MTQGIYYHNLRVDTSDGTFTILNGLIFVESNIGAVEYSGKKPNILNYNSFIDGTLKEASVLNAEIIPQFMFNNCNYLLNIIMPNVKRIEWMAFNNCTNLAITSLPDGIEFIGDGAFFNCTNLAITSLPSGITTIVSSAFYGCTNLTSLTFNGTPTRIDRNAFYGCTNLTDIYVPWSEGAVANAPWGATNATIHYNS